MGRETRKIMPLEECCAIHIKCTNHRKCTFSGDTTIAGPPFFFPLVCCCWCLQQNHFQLFSWKRLLRYDENEECACVCLCSSIHCNAHDSKNEYELQKGICFFVLCQNDCVFQWFEQKCFLHYECQTHATYSHITHTYSASQNNIILLYIYAKTKVNKTHIVYAICVFVYGRLSNLNFQCLNKHTTQTHTLLLLCWMRTGHKASAAMHASWLKKVKQSAWNIMWYYKAWSSYRVPFCSFSLAACNNTLSEMEFIRGLLLPRQQRYTCWRKTARKRAQKHISLCFPNTSI